MNKNQIIAAVALIVTTIGATSKPSGHVYAVAMQAMNLSQYNDVLGLCVASDLVTQKGDVLTLTAKGRDLALVVKAL